MKRLITMMVVFGLAMTIGFGQVIDDFETDIGNWDDPNFSGSTAGVDASSSITVSTEQAYAGSSSGKVDLIDDAGVAGGYFVRMTNRTDQIAPDSKLGFWVYTATQDVEFRLVIWDNGAGGDGYEAGPYWTVAAANTWEYFELDLANDAVTAWLTGNGAINSTDYVTIESIQFNTTVDADGVFYFDDITETTAPNASVTFSVDMSFQTTLGNFVPGTDLLDVAGTLNGWGGGDMLTDDNADGIYEGTFDVYAGDMEYKFRINSNWDTSEGIDNRTYTVVEGANVLPTVWYGDQEPVAQANVEVFVQVDMTVQLLNGNYDPDSGDLIVIRGGHDNFGNWGGATLMTLDPEQTNVYTHLSSFDNVPVGSGFEYKFVILTGGDVDQAIWEGSDNRSFTATGDEIDTDENGYGEILQPVAYFADVTPDDIITQDVTVTFNLDISSAARALANGDTLIDTQTGSDDITMWSEVNGVTINGILSQWWDWGNDVTCVGEWAMTQIDDEGHLFTFSYLYTAGQAKVQQCKFGINSLDNEAGFAQNRNFMIDDAAATYTVDNLCFGEQNSDPALPFPQLCGTTGPELFFSEYIEGGTGSNKAVEIYNGTGADVDLSAYTVVGTNNGTAWGDGGDRIVVLTGMLAAGDVYVLAADAADAAILAVADTALAYESPLHHNGDDGIALLKGGTMIDMIGVDGFDPGSGWAVAGVADATKDHTLIRKTHVMTGNHWNYSAGTDADNSEWLVMEDGFWASLGSHPYVPGNPVTFSVDMSFQATLGNFVPGTDALDVAGTLNEWGGGDMLTDDNADGIYVGTFNVPEGPMEYKFRINSNWDTSEGIDNRMYTVVAGENILPTVWYGNQEPVGTADVEVFVQVDMTVQLLNGNYDPGNGDLIVIRGGHDNYGNWGGATLMTLDPEQTNVYTHLSSFNSVPVGSGFEYKFVILTGGDVDQAIWEGSDNRSFTATGEETDSDENGYGEILQPVAYFADVTPDDIIVQDVSVTFNVDISSAYRALDAGDTLIDTQTGSDDITLWSEVNGVTINGVLSQWWDWGNDVTCVGEWAMTQTDTEGIKYSFTYLYTAGQAKSQQCKYGINSLDNESGFAQNRNFQIDDTNPTFELEEHCFGEHNTDANLPFPQSCAPLSIASLPGIPTSYALSQNYPNPFNPTTTINIALPEASNVVLTIYNALGQEVRSLKTDYLNAGNYSVTWDGIDNAGNMIPSGLYIYTLTAGNHNFSKKMLMLK